MLPFAFALLTAQAADPKHISSRYGCEAWISPTEDDGTARLVADCHWDDVPTDVLHTKLADAGSWHDYIHYIETSRVLGQQEKGALVWQRQKVDGLPAREDVVWMTSEPLQSGGFRHAWRLATEIPFALSPDAVAPKRNDGLIELRPTASGGTAMHYEATYHPGGNVPSWLFRAYQSHCGDTVLGELHAIAAN